MKPVITKFNDKTGDFEITIPVPFTLKDGIEYVDMMAADIPKYEDTKDYNVFELIRENQELKKQLSNSHQINAQQKEFIEWLENKLNMCDGFLDTIKSDLEEISYAGRVSGKTYIATQIMKNEIAMKCYEEKLRDIASDFLDDNGITLSDIRDAYIDKFVDDNWKGYTYLSAYVDNMAYKLATDLWLIYAKSTNNSSLEEDIKDSLSDTEYQNKLNEIQDYINMMKDDSSDAYVDYFYDAQNNLQSI